MTRLAKATLAILLPCDCIGLLSGDDAGRGQFEKKSNKWTFVKWFGRDLLLNATATRKALVGLGSRRIGRPDDEP